nr:MAG TPA: hypothetical protein [Caudoviricetes sp.]
MGFQTEVVDAQKIEHFCTIFQLVVKNTLNLQ